MTRATYVFRDGKLVPKHLAGPPPAQARGPQSSLPRPHYISDNIGGIRGLRHPSTGEFMDSKSRFRAETEARGLTEMGNEAFPVSRQQTMAELRDEVAREIADTYDQLEAGTLRLEDARPMDTNILNPDLIRTPDAAV